MTIRHQICAEALTWVGTPYHHHGRIRGVGVDCLNLLAAVYSAVGLVEVGELGHYSQTWHHHRSEELMAEGISRYMRRVDAGQPGDAVVFRFGRTHSHAGILIGDGRFVHAYARRNGNGSVIVSDMDEGWGSRQRDPWFWTFEGCA